MKERKAPPVLVLSLDTRKKGKASSVFELEATLIPEQERGNNFPPS